MAIALNEQTVSPSALSKRRADTRQHENLITDALLTRALQAILEEACTKRTDAGQADAGKGKPHPLRGDTGAALPPAPAGAARSSGWGTHRQPCPRPRLPLDPCAQKSKHSPGKRPKRSILSPGHKSPGAASMPARASSPGCAWPVRRAGRLALLAHSGSFSRTRRALCSFPPAEQSAYVTWSQV